MIEIRLGSRNEHRRCVITNMSILIKDQMCELLNHVYVINLDRSTNRLMSIANSLKSAGIHFFNRVSAVDGTSLCDDELHRHTTRLCRTCLCSKSMIGCALSHVRTWKEISKLPSNRWHLVLEDDALFLDKSIDMFLDLEQHLIQKNILSCDLAIINVAPNLLAQNKNNGLRIFTIKSPIFNYSTASYLLTTKTARYLLRYFSIAHYHIDICIFHSPKTRWFVYKTNINLVDNMGLSPELSNNMSLTTVTPLFDRCAILFPSVRFVMRTTLFAILTHYEITVSHLILCAVAASAYAFPAFSSIAAAYVSIEIILSFIILKIHYCIFRFHEVSSTHSNY